MRRRIKLGALAAGAAAFAVALPVLGQDAPQSLLPPGFGAPPPKAEKAPAATQAVPGQPVAVPPGVVPAAPGADEAVAESSPALLPSDIVKLAAAEATPPEEMPDAAKRSLALVGTDPVYGGDAFGEADG